MSDDEIETLTRYFDLHLQDNLYANELDRMPELFERWIYGFDQDQQVAFNTQVEFARGQCRTGLTNLVRKERGRVQQELDLLNFGLQQLSRSEPSEKPETNITDTRSAGLGTTPDNRNRFVLEGDYWSITFDGTTTRFRNTLGMRYIAHLIRNQGKEMLVSDLFYAINPPPPLETPGGADSSSHPKQLQEADLWPSDLGGAEDLIDPVARKSMDQRLKKLSEQMEDARERRDSEELTRLKEEQMQVAGYLASALGRRGRPRKASTILERMRKSVSKRIHKDRSKIKSKFPELGKHLDCIETGTFCKYAPDPEVEWQFESF